MTNRVGLESELADAVISLRRAKELDVEQLVPIINEAYSYQDAVKGEQRTTSDKLKSRMKEVDFYKVYSKQELIGCVYLEPREQVLHFGLLTLVPQYRGKGIAKKLMLAIEKYARNNSFLSIELDYMSLAPWLKRYYEKYGFEATGEVTQWGSIDLIKMRKSLS